nr:RNA polymerase sigma-70 factor [Hufsiella ginkgonis]
MIAEIRRRNRQVFEKIYKQYYKMLYMVAYKYMLNHESAEEIVHDIFIRIWDKAREIEIEISLKGYLVRSVANAALNKLKKDKLTEVKLEEYTRLETDARQQPADTEDTEEWYEKLDTALEGLPPQCRKVMMLSRFGKLKQQEIADQLGISVKTVKNHLTYGFNKIRLSMNID